jgi:hypothetical protein
MIDDSRAVELLQKRIQPSAEKSCCRSLIVHVIAQVGKERVDSKDVRWMLFEQRSDHSGQKSKARAGPFAYVKHSIANRAPVFNS